MVITPAEILQRIEAKEYLMINLENSNYYISRRGEVFSLNKPEPRMISATQRGSGEFSITLYVPELKVFNLADLILRTFKREPKDGELACYSNCEPQDVNISNLYWGTSIDRNQWRSKKNMARSKEVVRITKNSPEALANQGASYYCNKPFFNDILVFMIHLNRLTIQNDLCIEDKNILQRCLDQLSEIASISVLNFKKLEAVFEVEFETMSVNELFTEYKDVLVKNRKSYLNL